MKGKYILITALVLLASCGKSGEEKKDVSAKAVSLFSLTDPSQTGVGFINEVKDTEDFNILSYRNYYNGGGVAIGDINNDSLPDLYFTANQLKNKLYLNKGNFVFEDITEKAGVGGTKQWSTGVTMADVNGDGLLDIYVCNSGDFEGAFRENELFINNGDLTFTEKSKEYNLNNNGYSTHASFFDYDLDGDLDCYILNNSFRDPAKIELYKKMREQPDEGGDKLMRNDGNIFTDVTLKAGIYSSSIGFGLGVAAADLNNDNLPDLYISNDFWERDYLYINKGNGTFSEELNSRINYCPVSSMGSDIADLNNDGYPEIFTTDMLPADNKRLKTTIAFDPYHLEDLKYRGNFHYQMIQNCLQLNRGNGYFQEVALLAGVAATDWSWAPLIFDFENDGLKDIFVSNGIGKDIMSMDFREFLADAERKNIIDGKKSTQLEFIAQIPSQPLANYAFRNRGTLLMKDDAKNLGLAQPSFSNGSAYGDLDGDGDYDLVVNNLNSKAFLYRNNASEQKSNHYLKIRFTSATQNRFGIGAKVMIKTKSGIQTLENLNTRGFESSIEPAILFGLGSESVIEQLTVTWPDQKTQVLNSVKADRTLVLKHEDASAGQLVKNAAPKPSLYENAASQVLKGNATHREDVQNDFDLEILLPRMLSTEGPRIVRGDVNGDQQEDFILLGATGDEDKLFIQSADGSFQRKASQALSNDKSYESTCGVLFDYDSDGDKDLLIGSGGYEPMEAVHYIVRYYSNDGKGNFKGDPYSVPQVIGNFSTMAAADFDKDGVDEIFLGARVVPGSYGLPPRSYLLKNNLGQWTDIAPEALGNVGMVTDAVWADVDKDNDKDLVVVGDWMSVNIFYNENGIIGKHTPIPSSNGWWTRIHAADLDNDGDTDFVLGNWGLNTKFKATPSRPLTMFVKDFDGNGKSEFIINWYAPLDTTAYPFAVKPELTFQLPALRKKILKYEDYANKTYESLFNEQERQSSLSYSAVTLESAILWNEGKSFTLTPLPLEAQVAPIFGIIADDLDNDHITDLWLGGNFYALKPQAGRHDANPGVFLKGSGNRVFKDQSLNSGLTLTGEVRDAFFISGERKKIIVARNNDAMIVFQEKR